MSPVLLQVKHFTACVGAEENLPKRSGVFATNRLSLEWPNVLEGVGAPPVKKT